MSYCFQVVAVDEPLSAYLRNNVTRRRCSSRPCLNERSNPAGPHYGCVFGTLSKAPQKFSPQQLPPQNPGARRLRSSGAIPLARQRPRTPQHGRAHGDLKLGRPSWPRRHPRRTPLGSRRRTQIERARSARKRRARPPDPRPRRFPMERLRRGPRVRHGAHKPAQAHTGSRFKPGTISSESVRLSEAPAHSRASTESGAPPCRLHLIAPRQWPKSPAHWPLPIPGRTSPLPAG